VVASGNVDFLIPPSRQHKGLTNIFQTFPAIHVPHAKAFPPCGGFFEGRIARVRESARVNSPTDFLCDPMNAPPFCPPLRLSKDFHQAKRAIHDLPDPSYYGVLMRDHEVSIPLFQGSEKSVSILFSVPPHVNGHLCLFSPHYSSLRSRSFFFSQTPPLQLVSIWRFVF